MTETAIDLAHAFGFLYDGEVFALQTAVRDVVQSCRPGRPVIVNIGAGAGTSGLSIVEAGADYHFVWTVDISPGGPGGGLENERNAFRNAGILEKLPNQVLGDSSQVGRDWQGEKINLLFIDGDHSAEGLTADIRAWLPHMALGGWVLFHDYHAEVWPEVKRVTDLEMVGWVAVFTVDTLHARRMLP